MVLWRLLLDLPFDERSLTPPEGVEKTSARIETGPNNSRGVGPERLTRADLECIGTEVDLDQAPVVSDSEVLAVGAKRYLVNLHAQRLVMRKDSLGEQI